MPCSNPTPPTHQITPTPTTPPTTQAASLHALAKVLRGEPMDPSAPSWQPPAATVTTCSYAGDGGGNDEGAMDVAVEGAPEATGGEGQGAPVVSQAERCVFCKGVHARGACTSLYLYLYLYVYSTSCTTTSIRFYLPTKSPHRHQQPEKQGEVGAPPPPLLARGGAQRPGLHHGLRPGICGNCRCMQHNMMYM